ncbi:Rhs element Vgr protein, partial [Pseudomonas syringae pv. actinidiae ICMP 19071]
MRYLGNDGGLHDWQLVFAPWFSLLEYRLDCRIWQDKNLPAILEDWTCVANTPRCPTSPSSMKVTPTSCSAGASRKVFSGTSNTPLTSTA